MNQLDILRESLGQCDEILLDALLMRNRIVEDIMVYKEANDIPILQPEQEAKQREWLNRRMEGKRHKDEVTAVFFDNDLGQQIDQDHVDCDCKPIDQSHHTSH